MDDLRKVVELHCRRIALEIINFLINHNWSFWMIGMINKRVGWIESLFLAYPATNEYALAYGYPYRVEKNYWSPWLTGFLFQNGKISIMFSISAMDDQFINSGPIIKENLKKLVQRMEELRQLIGAKKKTFAGILPGVLYIKRIISEAPEADLTAIAVVKSVELVKTQESLDTDTPIIVLGGKGFIGRRVVKLLAKSNVYSLDLADGQDIKNWPAVEKRTIVLNITQNSAIADYLKVMRPKTVVINEVYPEPYPEILEELKTKDCNCYHLVGVEAIAFPSFPSVYRGAIPCCAAWLSENMKVIVKRIN